MKTFSPHPILYILLPLCVLAIASSFYRFMVVGSYTVAYEGTCDPSVSNCFVGYDDSTQKNFFYTKIHKYAPDVYAECGEDITDCADANACLPTDRNCSVEYCSASTVLPDESCDDINVISNEKAL